MTANQSIGKFEEKLNRSLKLLRTDPNFQTLVELWKIGRENMVQDLCSVGMVQKDIDRLRGGIFFADEMLRYTDININKGNGSPYTGIDSDEH